MIRYLTADDTAFLPEYSAFCEDDVFGLKAMGPVLSYGLSYDFVSAWEQRDAAGELTAFLSKYEGAVCVHATDAADREELLSFLRMIGFAALAGPADLLSGWVREGTAGSVMELDRGSDYRGEPSTAPCLDVRWDTDYPVFYELLHVCNPGYLSDDYPAFLTDLSHRVRHGTAHTVMLYENGHAVSAAAALVETGTSVLLGAVATRPKVRGNHYASTVLKELCDRYADRRIFLMCRPEKVPFYERLGMRETDHFLEISSSHK